MDLKPAASLEYPPHDQVTVVCHQEAFAILVYRDWNKVQQERMIGRGTWPVKSCELIGLKDFRGEDQTVHALDSYTVPFEVTVGRSPAMDRR